jgi:hypothetical protein
MKKGETPSEQNAEGSPIAGASHSSYYLDLELVGDFMSTSARQLLADFDSLPLPEQREVAAEILRRTCGTGDLPESALDELAAELFRSYDAEEAGSADRKPR